MEIIRTWDGVLFVLSFLLLLVGLAALYASSRVRPEVVTLFNHQLIGAGLGLIVLVLAAAVDYHTYRSWSKVLYVFALVLLVLVLLFGRTINGTTGWFRFSGISFQPVELVKFIWILVLANYLSRVGPPLNLGKTVAVVLLGLPPIGLILWQPDLGSVLMMVITTAVLLFAIPKPRRWWAVVAAVLIVVALVGTFFLKPYQKNRIATFLNPQADPLGSGYNVTQSIIAVGAGGWWGRGLGLGTQSQLSFLPEQHTDFIFASIAEELGVVGSLLVIGLWIGVLGRIWWLLRRLRDDFAVLIALGIGGLLLVQVVLNIGMNLGLAPVVGITLPLVSYGGSSLIATMGAIGILQNLARHYGRRAPQEVGA